MDTIRVSFIRMYQGKSPFSPDQNHVHHILLKRGYSHIKITIVLAMCSIVLILFAILSQPLGNNFVIFSLFGIGLSGVGIFTWVGNSVRFRSQVSPQPQITNETPTLSAKVITPSGGIKDLELNN
jgi:hypothetical protein